MLSFENAYSQRVSLRQLHIETTGLVWLEGSWEAFREETLRRMQTTVERQFGRAGLFLKEPPPGPLKALTYMAEIEARNPNDAYGGRYTGVVWFDQSLPKDLPEYLRSCLMDVDALAHAKWWAP